MDLVEQGSEHDCISPLAAVHCLACAMVNRDLLPIPYFVDRPTHLMSNRIEAAMVESAGGRRDVLKPTKQCVTVSIPPT